jgi:uncharacterized protein (DUF1786 family)
MAIRTDVAAATITGSQYLPAAMNSSTGPTYSVGTAIPLGVMMSSQRIRAIATAATARTRPGWRAGGGPSLRAVTVDSSRVDFGMGAAAVWAFVSVVGEFVKA